MNKLAIILIPVLLVACASSPKTESKSPVTANTEASKINQAEIDARKLEDARLLEAARKLEESRLEAARKLEEARNEARELQKQSVYFDFDKYVVKPEYRAVVRRQAEFVKKHKNVTVTLEGNADERGSNEYNLALGDKRANAVRKNMELLGVSSDQIRAVSMGEEKSRLSCHEEKCWKENRRNDFIHKFE